MSEWKTHGMDSSPIKTKLDNCLKIIRKYDWLINSYVLDFYVDNHWGKLPSAWRSHFDDLPPEHMCFLLAAHDNGQPATASSKVAHCVWPLSLLALKQAFQTLCIERRHQSYKKTLYRSPLLDHKKLKYIFNKGVKPKKRHELDRMASLCRHICQETPVDFVVDFGAGLGHLARALGYAYSIKVCCLEMQVKLNKQAYEMDANMEKLRRLYLTAEEGETFQKPEHVDLRLTADMTAEQFLETIEKSLNIKDKEYRFGIIGLHPCGDLGAILMRMFLKCEQAKFLSFVGCCYMKLTTTECSASSSLYGYPLSEYLRRKPSFSELNYESREISCHAVELYQERLSLKDYEYLKVHSFRAATERIIVKHHPDLKHTGLRSVKHSPEMRFSDYFYKAVKGLPCERLPTSDLCTSITTSDLSQWKNIVIFYTLRLFFAPLIESIILYDRMLFLIENDCEVQIDAIFDPRLSPRNHITTALKKS